MAAIRTMLAILQTCQVYTKLKKKHEKKTNSTTKGHDLRVGLPVVYFFWPLQRDSIVVTMMAKPAVNGDILGVMQLGAMAVAMITKPVPSFDGALPKSLNSYLFFLICS